MMMLNMRLLLLMMSIQVMSVQSKVNPGRELLKYLKKSNKKSWHQIKTRKAKTLSLTSPMPSPRPLYTTHTPNIIPVDGNKLHEEEFCVDVSTYQPVVWVGRDGEECKTEFVPKCEQKSENVCAEVTETFCEVSLRCNLMTILLGSVDLQSYM